MAREAKVSVASVSRALNGLSTVTEEMRAHIRSVADRMGYVPHAGARSLSLSRTHVVGVVLPDLHGEFFSELVRGLDRATTERGYQMLFCTAHDDLERTRQAVAAMHGRVDGLVLMAPHAPREGIAALLPGDLPAVLINSPAAPNRGVLRVDNRAGAAAIAQHLTATGRRRLVHISGPISNMDARERAAGFVEALALATPVLKPRIVAGDFQEASGAAAVKRLLLGGVDFDAIFAANDAMAFGALHALRAAGVGTPDPVAVAGFDDVPLAQVLGLTTLKVPLGEIGARAVEALHQAISGRPVEVGEQVLQPTLVTRASTGRIAS